MIALRRVTASLILVVLIVVELATTVSAITIPHAYFGGPDESKLKLNLATAARNQFLSKLSVYGVESLEDNFGANPTLTFPGTSVLATTGFSNGVNSQFAYSVSGTKFLWDTEGASDWLLFSEPVTAFGSYVVQGGDGASAAPTNTPTNTVTLRLENTHTGSSKDVFIANYGPDWPFYNVTFLGVTDRDPFDRVSIIESYDYDGLLFDDLIAGFLLPRIPGDTNDDGVVNFDDLNTLLTDYGQAGTFANGDFNDSGLVDFDDLNILLSNYGQTSPQSAVVAAVPEPSALLIGGLGILGVLYLARRAR